MDRITWPFKVLFLLFVAVSPARSQQPTVSAGAIHHIANFPSRYVDARNIDVWLPDDYDTTKRYNVVYMHDGQMLFDSTSNWNKQEWQVDEWFSKLMKAGKISDCIVVGIWNNGMQRHAEYFPQKPFESLSPSQRKAIYQSTRNGETSLFSKKVKSDRYLRFLVRELKPFIDNTYATSPDRSHTFIAGSSMGGLISLYAICEYPDVFGGAACLSTHWPGIFTLENNPIPEAFFGYLRRRLPDPITHKIYFDYGTATLDAMYPPLQKQVDEIMTLKGFTVENWITREFPGEPHSEAAWSKRLDIPILFLLKTP
jgi:predicted alpha/beta superfamily hydrolase